MAIEKRCANKNTLKGNSNALREYKKTITLNAIQKEVLVGTLLGDACLPFRTGKPVLSVEFGQNVTRANYIWHLHSVFENFVGTPPRVLNIRGGGARDRQCIRFRTYGHSEFKFYDSLFYTVDEHKKRVPKNLQEFLTPRALAYWFMDDGTSYTRNQKRYYVFSTHSFPLEDQEILVEALRENFSIHATIQKGGAPHRSYYKLYIRSKSTKGFVDLISPYIHPCFNYKIQSI